MACDHRETRQQRRHQNHSVRKWSTSTCYRKCLIVKAHIQLYRWVFRRSWDCWRSSWGLRVWLGVSPRCRGRSGVFRSRFWNCWWSSHKKLTKLISVKCDRLFQMAWLLVQCCRRWVSFYGIEFESLPWVIIAFQNGQICSSSTSTLASPSPGRLERCGATGKPLRYSLNFIIIKVSYFSTIILINLAFLAIGDGKRTVLKQFNSLSGSGWPPEKKTLAEDKTLRGSQFFQFFRGFN